MQNNMQKNMALNINICHYKEMCYNSTDMRENKF